MTTHITKPRIPKRLDISRSAYYCLPDSVPVVELTRYEVAFRKQYGAAFESRVGHYFFFTLPTPHARNAFLQSLESSCQQAGLVTRPGVIY